MEDLDLQSSRDARIRELEARQNRHKTTGIQWQLALAGMSLAVFFLWQMRLDVAYLFHSQTPMFLGREGSYDWQQLTTNAYVEIEGFPTTRGSYFEENGRKYVIVGMLQTPILVRRLAMPEESWVPGETPPQPSQAHMRVRGRLLGKHDAERYSDAFKTLASSTGLGAEWLLFQSEVPGKDLGVLLRSMAISTLLIVQTWLFYRAVLRTRRS